MVSEVSLEELKMESDVISLHVPLTEETKGMFNADFLNGLPRSVYLLNTARGPVVNTADLVAALRSGKVTGACLDVLEQESSSFEKVDQLSDSMRELMASEKVILSPHIAGWTFEAKQKMAEFLLEKILAEFGNC
jgi:D-3-phosphoglycerate dehydrogenase